MPTRGFLRECFFVARDAGRIVGFVCARVVANPDHAVTSSAPKVLQIEELYVRRGPRN